MKKPNNKQCEHINQYLVYYVKHLKLVSLSLGCTKQCKSGDQTIIGHIHMYLKNTLINNVLNDTM